MAKKRSKEEGEEGVGPRFKRGKEDLKQLEGIEKQRTRSRKADAKSEKANDEPNDDESYPIIDSIEKSKRRLKNRFDQIKSYDDAHEEFDE